MKSIQLYKILAAPYLDAEIKKEIEKMNNECKYSKDKTCIYRNSNCVHGRFINNCETKIFRDYVKITIKNLISGDHLKNLTEKHGCLNKE